MVHARINHGMVEVQDPIPPAWEGQLVKLVPLTPEDDLPDLKQRIEALEALGPMEYEPGEREEICEALNELESLANTQWKGTPEVLEIARDNAFKN